MRRVACGVRREPVPLPCSSQLEPARASPRLINTDALHSCYAHLLQRAVVTDAQLLLLYALQTLKNTEGAAGHASAVTRHRQCTCATCSCCSNQHSARAMHPFWPWGSGLLWLAAQVHHLHPAPQLRRAVLRARFLFQNFPLVSPK